MPLLAADEKAQSDRRMIDEALSGDPEAWDRLYRAFHGPLTVAICSILKVKSPDLELIDELAARVWYSVARDHGALLARFDPSRGCRLTTYLSSIAKDHAARMLRGERRRRRREAISCSEVLRTGDGVVEPAVTASLTIDEFERTLTPTERRFFREILSPEANSRNGGNANPVKRTPANQRQLGHRVRCKLEHFLRR